MSGYDFSIGKGSFFNRYESKTRVIVILVTAVLLLACLFAYFVVPVFAENYKKAHRLDNISEEMKAIDYVGRQYLLGEKNFMIPDEIINVSFKEIGGRRIFSCWTENAYYYGPAEEYCWGSIQLRDSVYD